MFLSMESEAVRRVLLYNYLEHVVSLLSSPAAVPMVLQRCLGADGDVAELVAAGSLGSGGVEF
jgi:hypothetical protein